VRLEEYEEVEERSDRKSWSFKKGKVRGRR
jgi:hypothetical protein